MQRLSIKLKKASTTWVFYWYWAKSAYYAQLLSPGVEEISQCWQRLSLALSLSLSLATWLGLSSWLHFLYFSSFASFSVAFSLCLLLASPPFTAFVFHSLSIPYFSFHPLSIHLSFPVSVIPFSIPASIKHVFLALSSSLWPLSSVFCSLSCLSLCLFAVFLLFHGSVRLFISLTCVVLVKYFPFSFHLSLCFFQTFLFIRICHGHPLLTLFLCLCFFFLSFAHPCFLLPLAPSVSSLRQQWAALTTAAAEFISGQNPALLLSLSLLCTRCLSTKTKVLGVTGPGWRRRTVKTNKDVFNRRAEQWEKY